MIFINNEIDIFSNVMIVSKFKYQKIVFFFHKNIVNV